MNIRKRQLDLLRLISIMLVMFGHYVSVGGGATNIPGIIGSDTILPLIDNSKWGLWKFEIFLIEQFSTQTGILGVSIFFVITGYLMPMMLERYTRTEFLVNRFFRIFPVLVIATIIVGAFVAITQNIKFSFSSYLASWTLSYFFIGAVPVMGVLWTLVIEVIFYAMAFLIGRFSVYRLFMLQVFLLALILTSIKSPNYYYMLIAMQAKYLLMITIGSAIFLAEKETDYVHKISLVLGSVFLSYLGFQIYKFGHEDISTYTNIGTHLLAAGLFLFFQLMSKNNLLNKIPNNILKLSDLVYPIYLLHAAIGLGSMAYVKQFTSNPYLILASAIMASVTLSYVVHILIEKPSIRFGRLCLRKL